MNTIRILQRFKIADQQFYDTVYYILGSSNSKNLTSYKYNPDTMSLKKLNTNEIAAHLVSGFSWLQMPDNKIFVTGGSVDPLAIFELVESQEGVLQRVN